MNIDPNLKIGQLSNEELEKLQLEVQAERDKLNELLLMVARERDARAAAVIAQRKVGQMSDTERAALRQALGMNEGPVGVQGRIG